MPRAKRKMERRITWRAASPSTAFRKLYKPLGYIAVTFADMEQMLTFAIAEHLHRPTPEAVAIEWLMQNLNNRIQLFYFLSQEWIAELIAKHPKDASDFEALRTTATGIFQDLTQANTDRNNLLHSPWTGIGTKILRSYSKGRYKADGGKLIEIDLRGITPKLLSEQAKYFISIRIRLWDWALRVKLCSDYQNWPAPLRDKYFLPSPLENLLRVNKGKAPRGPRRSSRR